MDSSSETESETGVDALRSGPSSCRAALEPLQEAAALSGAASDAAEGGAEAEGGAKLGVEAEGGAEAAAEDMSSERPSELLLLAAAATAASAASAAFDAAEPAAGDFVGVEMLVASE